MALDSGRLTQQVVEVLYNSSSNARLTQQVVEVLLQNKPVVCSDPQDWRIELYDTAGNRVPIPDKFIQSWDFELLERGGCGTFGLTLDTELDDAEFPNLPASLVNYRVDIWFCDTPAYRGWIEQPRPKIDESERMQRITGTGLMGRLGVLPVDAIYAKPYGGDAGEAFGWILDHFASKTEQLGYFTRAISVATGFLVERMELLRATIKTGFDRLADAAQDSLIWGCDFRTVNGPDRIYVQPRPTSVLLEDYRFRIGKDIRIIEQPEDLAEVANAIKLTGGRAKAANLAFNPSFEQPILPGYVEAGNLVQEPSFENALSTSIRSFNGGASRKQTGSDTGEYARSGQWFGEFDNPGESIVDLITLPSTWAAGTPIILLTHYACEANTSSRVFSVTLETMDGTGTVSAGTVLETLVNPASDPRAVVNNTSRSYQELRFRVVTTVGGVQKLRVTHSYVSSPGGLTERATQIDDVWVFRGDALAQDGWEAKARGTANATVDWAAMDAPYHGAYLVRAVTTGADGTNASSVWIRPTLDHWTSARTVTSYVVRVRVRTTAALSIRVGLERQKQGGGVDQVWGSTFTTTGGNTWELVESSLATDNTHTVIRPLIELRSNGQYELDGVQFYEGGISLLGADDYIVGEFLEFTFRADDALIVRSDLTMHATVATKLKSPGTPFSAAVVGKNLYITAGTGWTTGYFNVTAGPDGSGYVTVARSPAAAGAAGLGTGSVGTLVGLSAGAQASIANYGVRQINFDVAEVTDLAQAQSLAVGYFNRYAIPKKAGQLVLPHVGIFVRYVDETFPAIVQGMIAVGGADVAIADQFPAKIAYALQGDGTVQCTIDLTNRRNTPGLLIQKQLSASGGGVSGGGVGAGGSVNVRGGAYSNVPNGADGDAAIPLTNPMTAAGDLIVGGAAGAPARLAKGTDGQVLTLVSGAEAWSTPAGASSNLSIHNLASGAYTMLSADDIVCVTGTTGGTVTLPTGQAAGHVCRIGDKGGNAAASNIVIAAGGTDKINATFTNAKIASNNGALWLMYDGTSNWEPIAAIGTFTVYTPGAYDAAVLAETSIQHYWKLDEAVGSGTVADSKGTMTGTPTGVTFGGSGGTITTDGSTYASFVSSQILLSGNAFGNATAPWTFEAFMYWTGSGTQTFLSLTGAAGLGQLLIDSGGHIQGYDGAFRDTGAGHTLNTWQHVALTCDGANLKLYLNGVLAGTASWTPAASTTNASYIANDSANQHWTGRMQKVAIYNAALTLSQIATHYGKS